jgi:hypothetical protein
VTDHRSPRGLIDRRIDDHVARSPKLHRDPPTRPPHLVDDGYLVEPEPLDERVPYHGWESARDRWARAHRPAPLGCVHVALGICIGLWLAALVFVGSSIVDATPSSGQTTDRIDLSPVSSAALSGAPLEREGGSPRTSPMDRHDGGAP